MAISRAGGGFGPPAAPVAAIWPLSISANGRYLQRPDGTPFMLRGDTPWSLAVACTNTQIDSYLADRAGKGCTAILINAPEFAYSAQTPAYRNVDGVDPFTVMSPVNWVLNNTYWNRVDYIVNSAKALGMVVMINPAYTGYGGGIDGWSAAYDAASNATMQAYGEALANRYTQGNVMWCLGGDSADDDANGIPANVAYNSGTVPSRTKQWQIAIGIRNVRTTDIITGHTGRNLYGAGAAEGESYLAWGTGPWPGWNLNNTYGQDNVTDMVGLAVTAYGRSGPIPFMMIEAGYEDNDGSNPGGTKPMIQAVLGGALVGWFAGHDTLWHMGTYAPNNVGTATALSTYLAASWLDSKWFAALMAAYQWWKLEPKRDTSLVTVAPGTGDTLCPARASDGSFAMIFSPGTSAFTVNMNQLAPSSVRGRWYDVGSGNYTTASGSPYANSGTQSFTPPATSRILVLDAA